MKNTNFMASLKAFFSKAWTATKAFSIKAGKWVVANKLISIPVAVVLVGGIACAIALPIALHEHDFATEWSTDANNHWHSAICSHEEEKSDLGAHAYDNACDTTCNVCGATRTVGAHAYDNACDTTCNTCGATRTVGAHVYDNACDTTCNTCGATRTVEPHVYDNACDTTCNTCGAIRTVGAHAYDNDCDTTCNNCGATRTITHDHADTLTAGDTTHWYACSVCGDKKDEVAHVFDKTVASSEYLKAAATATTKEQYYKSCVCGKASANEYFEIDKAPANLQVSDISKTYDGTRVAEPTVTFDGLGAENFAYYKGNEKLTERPTDAGTYKVVVTVDETETHAGDRVEREFTIAKKVLSNLSVDLTYAGTNSFEVHLGSANGILADDVADGIKVCITFADKNVGAAVTGAGLDADDGDNYTNYELDFTTCTASIVPKVLTNISVGDVTYKGSTNFAFVLSASHGLVSGENFLLQVTTASKNVGNAVEITSVSYANNNYSIDKSAITLNIVPKTLNYLEITKVYDGEGVLAYALGTEHGVVAGDEVLFYCDEEPDYNVGTYNLIPENDPTSIDDPGADDRASLAGADKANYKFAERIEGKYKLCATITVTPKTLRVGYLIDETISKTYDGTNVFTQSLSTTHGILNGDTVSVSFAVTEWDGTKDVALIDSDTYEGGRYTARDITLTGESAGNYVVNANWVDIEQSYTVEILSKAITLGNEGISFTLVPGQKVYEYTLTPAHGIVANETVIMRVEFTNAAVGAPVKPAGVKFLVGGTEVVNYHLTSTDNIKLVNA